MLIAVSGNVGSGKTTLARYIAQNYGFRYVPTKRLEFDFLEDFFKDIEGKFFPAQVSFLLSKAIEIQANSKKHNIVVDRSLMEDISVFAKLWIDNNNIDEKTVELYNQTARFITSAIPSPDLYIMCCCPPDICATRIKHRPARKYEALYPPHHIEKLGGYCEGLSLEERVRYVEIDASIFDFTNELVLKSVCESIFNHLEQHDGFEQLSLYDESAESVSLDLSYTRGLVFHNFEEIDYFTSFKQPTASFKYMD